MGENLRKQPSTKKRAPKQASARPTVLARISDLAALLGGQRRDMDALATVLQGRDLVVNQGISTAQASADGAIKAVQQVIEQLNRTTEFAFAAHDRLSFYERRVPQLAAARKAYDADLRRRKKGKNGTKPTTRVLGLEPDDSSPET